MLIRIIWLSICLSIISSSVIASASDTVAGDGSDIDTHGYDAHHSDPLDPSYYDQLDTPLEQILGVAKRIERKFDSVDQKADQALSHAEELPDLIAIVKKHEFAIEYVKETQKDLRGEVRSNTKTTSRNTKLINDVALNLALVAQTVGEWKSGKDKDDGVKSGIFITVLSGVIIIIITWLFNLKGRMLKLLFIYKRLLRISRGKSNQKKKEDKGEIDEGE